MGEVLHSGKKLGHKLVHVHLYAFSFHSVSTVEATWNGQYPGRAWIRVITGEEPWEELALLMWAENKFGPLKFGDCLLKQLTPHILPNTLMLSMSEAHYGQKYFDYIFYI